MLPFTSVARVWPFWLVVGRCRVMIFFFFFIIIIMLIFIFYFILFYFFYFFIFRISVVEKGGVVRTPWTPPLDPPLDGTGR